jgi:lipoate---protein ligase
MSFRLIVDSGNAAENMAADYAILQLYKLPTLRLYTWKPAAVSIGRFQSMHDEIDIDYCRKSNIGFVRRITGGGAVFHDKELTYSFCIAEKNDFFSQDLHESYKAICGALMKGMAKLGIKTEYKPINDIVCIGRKISGCAQTRKKGVLLQHGTLLIGVDVEKMFRILKVPKEKISDKMIADVKQRVTSLNQELGREITEKELGDAVIWGFKETFGVDFTTGKLTTAEVELKKKLESRIFNNKQWLFER